MSGNKPAKRSKAPTGTRQAAWRLWAASKPVADSPVAAYLASRQIIDLTSCEALRFHGNCWYRPSKDDAPATRPAWPALIAAVTDLDGSITGVHRTFLETGGADKAPVPYPRRAMGTCTGPGVTFGRAGPSLLGSA